VPFCGIQCSSHLWPIHVPGVFHILRLVDAYRDLDLEAFVRTALADLHRIPLGRLGTHGSRRYDDLHSKPAYIISYHISCLAARNLSRGGGDTRTQGRNSRRIPKARNRLFGNFGAFGEEAVSPGLSVKNFQVYMGRTVSFPSGL